MVIKTLNRLLKPFGWQLQRTTEADVATAQGNGRGSPAFSEASPTSSGGADGPQKQTSPFLLGSQGVEETVGRLLDRAIELEASDVFITCLEDGVEVVVRRLGIIQRLAIMPRDLGMRCLSHIRVMAGLRIDERRHPQDGRWIYRLGANSVIDLRINTIPTLYGESLAIRLLFRDAALQKLDALGMVGEQLPTLESLLYSPGGLILLTGPTGSGKTTTLYACLQHLNDGTRVISSIEDPIEYSIKGIRQTQVDEINGAGFAEMLRAVVRQGPDVIMIGEVRDEATAETAVRAANSGQLVFATMHAPTAAAAVGSILGLRVPSHFVASTLLAVVSQRLARTLDPQTRVPIDLSSAPRTFEDVRPWLKDGEGQIVYAARDENGYSGRTGVFELMTMTTALREMIFNREPAGAIARQAREEGMIDLSRAALIKVAQGVTSFDEIQRVLPDPEVWTWAPIRQEILDVER